MAADLRTFIPIVADPLVPRWFMADPVQEGLDADVLLVRAEDSTGYRPTITISRYAAEQSPAAIAQATRTDAGAGARVLDREERADYATQLVELTAPDGGGALRLAEVILVFRSSVTHLVDTSVVARLMCTPGQFPNVATDFETLVASLGPDLDP